MRKAWLADLAVGVAAGVWIGHNLNDWVNRAYDWMKDGAEADRRRTAVLVCDEIADRGWVINERIKEDK